MIFPNLSLCSSCNTYYENDIEKLFEIGISEKDHLAISSVINNFVKVIIIICK